MEALVAQFGYWAVLIGTFLEGETILIAAGYAAHRGWLEFWPVVGVAFVGSAAGDQLYFWIGHSRGLAFLESRPSLKSKIATAQRLLHRHSALVILATRFLYGLRIALPFLIGASRVPIARFFVLNILGAAIWAVCFGGLGYLVGSTFQAAFDRFERYEQYVLIALVGAAIVWAAVRALRARSTRLRAAAERTEGELRSGR